MRFLVDSGLDRNGSILSVRCPGSGWVGLGVYDFWIKSYVGGKRMEGDITDSLWIYCNTIMPLEDNGGVKRQLLGRYEVDYGVDGGWMRFDTRFDAPLGSECGDLFLFDLRTDPETNDPFPLNLFRVSFLVEIY